MGIYGNNFPNVTEINLLCIFIKLGRGVFIKLGRGVDYDRVNLAGKEVKGHGQMWGCYAFRCITI